MKINKNIEFHKQIASSIESYGHASSVEDDLMASNIRLRQQLASSSCEEQPFMISLKPITDREISHNYVYSPPKQIKSVKSCQLNKHHPNKSFFTTDDSFDQSIEPKSTKECHSSLLSKCKSQKTTPLVLSPLSLPKLTLKTRKNTQKILEGLMSLAETFKKVEQKNLTFRFTHLKMFSQKKKLEDQKTFSSRKISYKGNKPDKRKEFYRQWFKIHKITQIDGNRVEINTDHTVGVRF